MKCLVGQVRKVFQGEMSEQLWQVPRTGQAGQDLGIDHLILQSGESLVILSRFDGIMESKALKLQFSHL